jgi:hypothetical protein
MQMKKPWPPTLLTAGTLVVTLIGAGFFFAIIGVFGLPAAIGSLALFIALALLIFHCPQIEELRP